MSSLSVLAVRRRASAPGFQNHCGLFGRMPLPGLRIAVDDPAPVRIRPIRPARRGKARVDIGHPWPRRLGTERVNRFTHVSLCQPSERILHFAQLPVDEATAKFIDRQAGFLFQRMAAECFNSTCVLSLAASESMEHL